MPSVERGWCRKHHSLRLLPHQLREASSIQVPDVRKDVLLERRNTLPSAPERRRPEQVRDRPSKEDRLEYHQSLAWKGSLRLSSVQRSKNSCARHRGASGRRDSDDRRWQRTTDLGLHAL